MPAWRYRTVVIVLDDALPRAQREHRTNPHYRAVMGSCIPVNVCTSPLAGEIASAGALTRPAGVGLAAGGPRMSKGRERVRVQLSPLASAHGAREGDYGARNALLGDDARPGAG